MKDRDLEDQLLERDGLIDVAIIHLRLVRRSGGYISNYSRMLWLEQQVKRIPGVITTAHDKQTVQAVIKLDKPQRKAGLEKTMEEIKEALPDLTPNRRADIWYSSDPMDWDLIDFHPTKPTLDKKARSLLVRHQCLTKVCFCTRA